MDLEALKNKIKESYTIEEVASKYTKLTRSGSGLKGSCPIHFEKTASFSVKLSTETYKCFGCGAGGDLISLTMQMETISYPEALVFLAEQKNIELNDFDNRTPEEIEADRVIASKQVMLKQAAEIYAGVIKQPKYAAALNYLVEKRGIDLNQVNKYMIGYCPTKPILNTMHFNTSMLASMNLEYEFSAFFGGRIVFPFVGRMKKVIGFTGRAFETNTAASGPKYKNSADSEFFHKSSFLYNLNHAGIHIRKTEHAFLVEGQMDVVLMDQYNFHDVVAASGTAFTGDHADELVKANARRVTILFDGDAAGQRAMLKMLPILLSRDIMVDIVKLDPAMDPADYLKHGEHLDEFIEIIENKQSYIDFFYDKIKNYNNLNDRIRATDKLVEIANHINNKLARTQTMIHIGNLLGLPIEVISETVKKLKK